MPSIGTVSADLVLNSASFISNFQKAADATARNTRQISGQMTGLQASVANASTAFKGFIAGFATVSTVQSLVRLGQTAIDTADEIGSAAKRIGSSAEELQQFRFAADQANVSTGELDAALKIFGKNLAQGNLATSQVTLTGALNEYIARIAAVPSFTEKARIATEGFGRQWQIGIALASEGAGKFAENAKGAFTISDALVRKADALNDAFARVRNAISAGFATGFLEEFGKGLAEDQKALEDLNQTARRVGQEIGQMANDVIAFASAVRDEWNKVTAVIDSVVGVIERVVGKIQALKGAISGLWDMVPGWAQTALTMPGKIVPGAWAADFLKLGGGGAGLLGQSGAGGGGGALPSGPGLPAFPTPPKPWWEEPQFKAELAASAARAEADTVAAAATDKFGKSAAGAVSPLGTFGQGVTASASDLGDFGSGVAASAGPLGDFQVSVVGADRHLGTFGDGLESTGGDLDAFGQGLRDATGSFGQFSAGLGGFGNGLGAAGLGLNSFNTGMGGLIQTTGFTSMSLGALGKAADLSRLDVQAALAGSRDAFMKGAGYLNDMSKAGLMLTQEFLRWQAELRSRRVIVNESGQFEVAPAFGANAKGDFSAVLALKQKNLERAASLQQAALEEKEAKKAAKQKQKELEKEVMRAEKPGMTGSVTYGRPIPAVHITLQGSETTKYTRDEVIALMDQMGEAIGDGARISIT